MAKVNKRYLGQINSIVNNMSGNNKEIYNCFNREDFKKAFYSKEIIECEDDKKDVPDAIDIDKKIKTKLKKILLSIKCKPKANVDKPSKNKSERIKGDLNSFQFLKDENYRLYKLYSNLAGEYKDNIRKEVFDTFNIKSTAKTKKARDKEMEEYIYKFNCACNGEGDELRKISLVASSSLCAFLCFYKVSEKYPLYIKTGKKMTKFTESIFEWENPLFGRPSSIDVVLVGTYVDNPKQKVVYFIESKFSEYYRTYETCIVPPYYITDKTWKRLYSYKNLKSLNLKIIPAKNANGEKEFVMCEQSGCSKQYANGVQQMFRHYIGVNNLLNGKKEHNFGKYLDLENTDIYLGTIIFRIMKNNTPTEAYSNYQNLGAGVADKLTKDLKTNYEEDYNFIEVSCPKIYQNIFSSDSYEGKENLKNLTEEIKTYYGFE